MLTYFTRLKSDSYVGDGPHYSSGGTARTSEEPVLTNWEARMDTLKRVHKERPLASGHYIVAQPDGGALSCGVFTINENGTVTAFEPGDTPSFTLNLSTWPPK